MRTLLKYILGSIAAYLAFFLIRQLFIFTYLFIELNIQRLETPNLPIPTNKVLMSKYLRESELVFRRRWLFPFKNYDLTLNRQPAEQVIVLVHGYTRSQTDWIWFRKQLKTNIPIYTANLSPKYGNIHEMALSLATKIEAIKDETGCNNIIIIAHSMGGIVAHHYAHNLDTANRVSNIVAIGTPWYGTKLAFMEDSLNAQAIQPQSIFLNELRQKIFNSPIKHYSIASRFDNMIYPWSSALLDKDSEQKLILEDVSHLAMLFSNEVVEQINTWLSAILLN